jgi:hypothetical protein
MAITSHAAPDGTTIASAAATEQFIGLGRPAQAPCGNPSGHYQCCGTHCPCPSASFISADAGNLGAMLVPSFGGIAAPYQPARSAKSPDERPPR